MKLQRNNTNYSNVNAATQTLLYCGLKVAYSAKTTCAYKKAVVELFLFTQTPII
jgi:hypothetical protein